MARKYLCDNCGSEVKRERLVEVWLEGLDEETEGDYIHIGELGEFCSDCLATLQKIVKEGFSKGRA